LGHGGSDDCHTEARSHVPRRINSSDIRRGYPQRTGLNILGHARVEDARQHPELVTQPPPEPEIQRVVERLFFINVVSFDWNCPQYITPRYTAAEVEVAVAPL